MRRLLGYTLWLILLMAIALVSSAQENKLPKILNPGDTAIATVPVWVQSVESEVNQRLIIKQLGDKIEAYSSKVKELDVLQALLDAKTKEKEDLITSGYNKADTVITRLSAEITKCNDDVQRLSAETSKLQKQIKRLEAGRNTWRTVSITQGLILVGAALLFIFKP